MKYVYYIGNFDFYLLNAQAQLVLSNGRILRELGYEVVYIGSSSKLNHCDLSASKMIVDGFIVYTVSFSKRLNDLLEWRKLDCQIKELLMDNIENISAVILYGSPSFAIQINSISKWCKNKNIKLIANCVDVSATSHGNFVERIVKTFDLKWKNLIFTKNANGIIAVSNYIARYFNKGKKKVITIIPPLKDCNLMPTPQTISSSTIKLVYAGIPFPIDGRKVDVSSYKDRLDLVLELFYEVYKENRNVRLDIYGLTSNQYLSVIQNHNELLQHLKDGVYFHGIKDTHEVMHAISEADFTINLRDVNQMTTAGFSTKFVESISCGTPAITTNTSDLLEYIVEGKNGFFVDINDRNKAINELNEILSIDKENIKYMKRYCYESKIFDYRNYIERMKQFLLELNL